MILVYYRRNDGTIRHFHRYPTEKGLEVAREAARQYNAEHFGEETAYIVQYADDSIEAFMFQKTLEKKKYDKEALEELISALGEALDAARYLEG